MTRQQLIILLLFWAMSARAQPGELFFVHYGLAQKLSTRTTHDIVKTPDGFVWVSSNEGLIRFDGRDFKYFRNNPSDSTSIFDNHCYDLCLDGAGRIWVATFADVEIFDPLAETFSRCGIRDDSGKTQAIQPISFFFDSTENTMWVAAHQGLFYAKNGGRELTPAPDFIPEKAIASQGIACVTKDSAGQFWLGNTFGLYKYDPRTGIYQTFHLPAQDPKVPNDEGVFCLFPDKNGVLWVGTWGWGLVRFDTKTGQMRQFNWGDRKREHQAVTHIAASGAAGFEQLLFCGGAGKFKSFDKATGKFTIYKTANEGDPLGVNGWTFGLCQTESEGLWIGSETGLHRLDFSKQYVKNMDLAALDGRLATAPPIGELCIQRTKTGRDSLAWFFVGYIGGFVYDMQRHELKPCPAKLRQILDDKMEVYTLFMDSRNVLWVGCRAGLIGYDVVADAFVMAPKQRFFRDWEWVWQIFEDSGGRLWLGTTRGLHLLSADRKTVAPIAAVNSHYDSLQTTTLFTGIGEDARGRIWFSTETWRLKQSEIGVFDPATVRAAFFSDKKENHHGLPNYHQYGSLVCDAKNRVYVASNKGIVWFDANEMPPKLQRLGEREGLAGQNVTQVLLDGNGRLWANTEFGIACFMENGGRFLNFTFVNALVGTLGQATMSLSEQSGAMYLGRGGSIRRFSIRELRLPPPPKVLLTDFQLGDSSILSHVSRLNSGEVIRLSYRQNFITARFAALHFSDAQDNLFAYRLDGGETDWHETRENFATYAGLLPGEYTLLVKAANSAGIWNETPARLRFVIEPPFWQTWWFYALCFLFAAGVVYYVVHQRFMRIRERLALRNRISADLHDEIGSTLTSINILSGVSQKAFEQHPETAKEMLQHIQEQSREVQQNMSDIVWAIRADKDKIEDLLVRLKEYATQTLEPAGLTVRFDFGNALLAKRLGMAERKEVLLIFREALTNIIKHAGASCVEVRMLSLGNAIQLIVKDDGSWKSKDFASGSGTKSMAQRAKSIGGDLKILPSEAGTAVVLTVPIS